MKAWFEELSGREQSTLLFGGGALFIMFFYLLLWAPLSEESDRLKSDVQSQRATLAWMQQAATQVVSSNRSVKNGGRGESLLTLVDRTGKAAKLGGLIKRIQPDKEGGVRIWLEDIQFNKMIIWLKKLANDNGVVLVNSNIEKQSVSGLVNARLTFKSSAS